MAAVESLGARKSQTQRRRKSTAANRQIRDDVVPTPPIHEFDRPADVQALRDARLRSLQTPARERRKMKIEYTYERPVRAATSNEKPVKRASSIFGFGGTSAPKAKPKRTEDVRNHEAEVRDDGQYVYDRPQEQSRGRAISREISGKEKATERKPARTEQRTSSSKQTDKIKVERRKTDPAIKRTNSIVGPAERPTLRKSTTAIPIDPSTVSRPPVTRAATEISIVKSPNSARKSSLLGSFLAGPPPQPERRIACLTCGSDDIFVSKAAKLPCGHRMCHTCLKRIFKMSISDPAHMPPRCCTEKHIDLKHVDALFDQEFKKVWNRKFKEYNAKNRIYCPARGCGEWIQPKHMTVEQGRKVGRCPKCKTYVCGICNQKAHRSKDCPKDPSTRQFVEVAKEKGWQRCYNCSAMVELREGCNHMTCRCTAEFCMVCGLKWKSCDCPWFNYEAVDEHLGNPVRYQQELDRRRDQERRDEEFARRLERLGIRAPDNEDNQGVWGIGNAAGHHLNQNFVQQAREALTANYQNAEQAARGLLNGFFTGRENALPDFPHQTDERIPNFGHADLDMNPRAQPASTRRRQTVRRQAERQTLPDTQDTQRDDHDRRIREWANGVDTRT